MSIFSSYCFEISVFYVVIIAFFFVSYGICFFLYQSSRSFQLSFEQTFHNKFISQILIFLWINFICLKELFVETLPSWVDIVFSHYFMAISFQSVCLRLWVFYNTCLNLEHNLPIPNSRNQVVPSQSIDNHINTLSVELNRRLPFSSLIQLGAMFLVIQLLPPFIVIINNFEASCDVLYSSNVRYINQLVLSGVSCIYTMILVTVVHYYYKYRNVILHNDIKMQGAMVCVFLHFSSLLSIFPLLNEFGHNNNYVSSLLMILCGVILQFFYIMDYRRLKEIEVSVTRIIESTQLNNETSMHSVSIQNNHTSFEIVSD